MNKNKITNIKTSSSHKKQIAIITSCILSLCIMTSVVIAFLMDNTEPVNNTFTPSEVTTDVEETLEGTVKKNVKIKNTGNTESYIRAAVIITWQDAGGNIYRTIPVEGDDYNITWSGITDNSWFKGSDGFYYHKSPVLPVTVTPADDEDAVTSILFTECKVIRNSNIPENYKLNVEIIGSGIQSTPTSVVEEQWNVNIDENNNIVSNK